MFKIIILIQIIYIFTEKSTFYYFTVYNNIILWKLKLLALSVCSKYTLVILLKIIITLPLNASYLYYINDKKTLSNT